MSAQLGALAPTTPTDNDDLLALWREEAVPRAALEDRTQVPELEFDVLGSLAVRCRGVDITPSAPKIRRVLAMLLLNANREVKFTELYDELWDDEPPRTASAVLQTYVYKLRGLFRDSVGMQAEQVTKQLLITRSGGYLIRLSPDQLDLSRFERLVNEGGAGLRAGRPERAADCLRRALDLWRGSFIDYGLPGSRLHAHIVRLEERRHYAQMTRIEADLCRGAHQEVISELSSLVVEHPLHESAHSLLMVALHRSGRTSAALAVFQTFRHRMRDEMGIEPSARMQALHTALLSAAPVLGDRRLTSDTLLDRIMA